MAGAVPERWGFGDAASVDEHAAARQLGRCTAGAMATTSAWRSWSSRPVNGSGGSRVGEPVGVGGVDQAELDRSCDEGGVHGSLSPLGVTGAVDAVLADGEPATAHRARRVAGDASSGGVLGQG